jgi:DNA-directed RNA polymerase specialized sigma24 family protein
MRTEAPYEKLRPLLFSIAHRMVSSVSEAEDIVQEGSSASIAPRPAARGVLAVSHQGRSNPKLAS